jgi:chloride channel protein, CIC family
MFMIGGALGALGAHVLPGVEPGFWPLVCLAAVIGGVMRAPFTAVVFASELTGRWDAILPMLIAASTAYLLTALLLKRSVLTEKVARRGFHLTREYDVDPLVVLFVREVMDVDDIVVHDAGDPMPDVLDAFGREGHGTAAHRQRLYPVVGEGDALLGVLTRRDMLDLALRDGDLPQTAGDAMTVDVVVAHPDETLRDVAYRMAETATTRMPVVTRGPERRLVGIITLPALLAGRLRDLQESRDAQRVMRVAAFRRRRALAR